MLYQSWTSSSWWLCYQRSSDTNCEMVSCDSEKIEQQSEKIWNWYRKYAIVFETIFSSEDEQYVNINSVPIIPHMRY